MIPDISIIITSYNYGKYIDRCLRSCLNQKDVNFEIIIVDDCSTDDTEEKIAPYLSDKRVTFVKLQNNVGVSVASNMGIMNSRGRFFIRVDADDFVNDKMCYFLHNYLQNNRKVFGVACDYIYVNEYEEKIERLSAEEKPISCGVMYRTDSFKEIGGYNSDYRNKEHEVFLQKLKSHYTIDYLKLPLYRYRRHGNNKTLSKEYKDTKI